MGVRYDSRTAAVCGVTVGEVCVAAGDARAAGDLLFAAGEDRAARDLDIRAATTWCLETGENSFNL